MIRSDLESISTVMTAPNAAAPETEHIDEYHAEAGDITVMKSLKREPGVLSVGGHSRTLFKPVKSVWYNRTRRLVIYTPFKDEYRVNRYVEAMIRRTFGTDDAMKKAGPVK